ncbi:uncharacterized protein VTP21DRAFT_3739 [Calcarisporiella thermophila]|uniref:uncharacterized protein n=1 Tax=Calcarisporiella thermophila TaxID=911321 RepID=UPI003742449B
MTLLQDKLVVYTLELGDDGSPEDAKKYVRLGPPEQAYILRFKIVVGSLASRGGRLVTNYPVEGGEFDRKKFHKLEFKDDPSMDGYCDLVIEESGAYEYFIEYQNWTEPHKIERSDSGHFMVEPRLRARPSPSFSSLSSNITPKSGGMDEWQPLPLDGIVIASVIAKWLGPFPQWAPHLRALQAAGYNWVHFVPLQVRGASDSPYSIADQLDFSHDLYADEEPGAWKTKEERFEIMRRTLERVRNEFGLNCLSDVVWNHTAHNSEWLLEHPEAGYNLINSPHLAPAYELDTAFLDFSARLKELGLPTVLTTRADLDKVMDAAKDEVIKKIRLWEYYVVDVESAVAELRGAIERGEEYDSEVYSREELQNMTLKQLADRLAQDATEERRLGKRFGIKINVHKALAFMKALEREDAEVDRVCKRYHALLNEVNLPLYIQYDDDTKAIIENVANRAAYTRLAKDGPNLGEITREAPLIETYFTRLPKDDERTRSRQEGELMLANNGWIWNANPLQDFASNESQAYLRREVIVWGDCVKLRYGRSPDDNPWLWEHMRLYTEKVASLFHGFRIDNCHSTPIHVAEYFLDAARRVRKDLYVVAELFTGSETMDVKFVSRLGITSLIREAMQAWDPRELSRLLHRHGGKPVGSMDMDCLTEYSECVHPRTGAVEPCVKIPLSGSTPHALFMDCTHDNETPHQKRRAEDTLSNAALVAMSACAIGSVKGYDEVYPTLLDLVKEKRHYEGGSKIEDRGIGKVKRVLQHLHTEMARKGFIETHVHHEDNYIMVHRQHPSTHQGYLLVAHTAFANNKSQRGNIAPIKLRGSEVEHIFTTTLDVLSRDIPENKTYLRGLRVRLEALEAPMIKELTDEKGMYTEVVVPREFPAGSVMLLRTWIRHTPTDLITKLQEGVEEAVQELGSEEMNVLLYRCDGEEQDSVGRGVYKIPGWGALPYCGLEGFMSVLKPIMKWNDLGHPFCAHLRDGRWALDYCVSRLEEYVRWYPKLDGIRKWLESHFKIVQEFPNFLLPKYFALVLNTVYQAARKHATKKLMSEFIRNGDFFTRSLSLCALQMYGRVSSTGLHPTEPGASMAAGLPHFTHQHMRCWGRDVFISLRGLYLVTGQFEAARRHIIAFGGSLKHGLIPNLLDAVRYPRYNARDAAWWFTQAVQDYCKFSPEGLKFLEVRVPRRFPDGDTFVEVEDERAYSRSSTIAELVQEIMQRHAKGISFREWNAGPALDTQMTDPGFNVTARVDWTTGFVCGGNRWNCGTWMDKMGESERAGNKGVPATPRDGAAVEIVGLEKSAVRWLASLWEEGKYPYEGVVIPAEDDQAEKKISYKEWGALIQSSFERCFYIPTSPSDDSQYALDPKLINRRGIYKDTYGSAEPYCDYQLRPNFAVAMVVAPELFDAKHAASALEIAKKIIMGPLGMRTLDPADWAYRPNYDNSNDGADRLIAKGWNYHQGPEWVWCAGYFLRALLIFQACGDKFDAQEVSLRVQRTLLPHKRYIQNSPWAGLPELTNKDGAPCTDSCPTQAWSAATILDLIWAVKDEFQKRQDVV